MQILKVGKFNKCHLSDSLLWDQLKKGEKDGLEGIYVKFSPELFRYGMAIKSNRSFVKDCIQELFIDLWKYKNSLKETDNVKLYLFRSLSNKIFKEVSREKKRCEEDGLFSHEYIFLEGSVEDSLISIQGNEKIQLKLRKALEGLPTRQRQVIQHLFFESHAYEETSKIMGINVESIYTLAWKAIANLKKSILIFILAWMVQ